MLLKWLLLEPQMYAGSQAGDGQLQNTTDYNYTTGRSVTQRQQVAQTLPNLGNQSQLLQVRTHGDALGAAGSGNTTKLNITSIRLLVIRELCHEALTL